MSEITSLKNKNKTASLMLSHLFHDKIIQLEANSKEKISFSKQSEIMKKHDEILKFVEKRPTSSFELRVLNKNSSDKEDYSVGISFTNYEKKDKTDPVNSGKFMIVIDAAFNTVSYYEWALNNVLLSL